MLWLRGGEVLDGTGTQPVRADVVIAGGAVHALLPASDQTVPAPNDDVLDISGLTVTPGFIDMHAHADLALVRDTALAHTLAQGVTTQVVGQDGIAYAPVDDVTLPLVRRQIRAWNGDLPDEQYTWRTFAGYLSRLSHGTATNAVVLVPHSNLRLLAAGAAARPVAPAELAVMTGLLEDALAAGGRGMSSGLTYPPGMYADRRELVALCRVLARHDSFWAPHTRSYGVGALDAYREAIQIAGEAGCGLHLTHATMNFAENRGRAPELLALVDDAIADGVDVTLDSYPYLAGATTLAALLPGWVSSGGADEVRKRLGDADVRQRVRRALDVDGSDGAHGAVVDWTSIQISSVERALLAHLVGHSVDELAKVVGQPPSEVALNLLVADDLGTGILMHVGDEENVRTIMAHDSHCGGSDGIAVGGRPHPRAWGTFPRFLGRYARDLGIVDMPSMVAHLTARPARRLGLADRGLVRTGYRADLVVLDPATVGSPATYEDPTAPPTGIVHVLVNGSVAVREGRRTAALAGTVL